MCATWDTALDASPLQLQPCNASLRSQAWSYARYAKNLGVSQFNGTRAGGSQSGVGRRLLDAAAGGLQSFGALVGSPGALLRLAN